MFSTTIKRLQCVVCSDALKFAESADSVDLDHPVEVRTGTMVCVGCGHQYLILEGVALLVSDTENYLLEHVKGISKTVKPEDLPKALRRSFKEAVSEIQSEHIEEDLESERVNALYLMNHYLKSYSKPAWWKPAQGTGSELIESLVLNYWDQGPFSKIQEWVKKSAGSKKYKSILEMGCGVGGLQRVLAPYCDFYLGMDSSFASIAFARQIGLGISYSDQRPLIPEDLLHGPVSRNVEFPIPQKADGSADFVVTDFTRPAVGQGWDVIVSLNMIDMLDTPEDLIKFQYQNLVDGGLAIQSSPYIWAEPVAAALRKAVPKKEQTSSSKSVEWIYQQTGFVIENSVEHLPWLFFKHVRQLEIYSVHMLQARKQ